MPSNLPRDKWSRGEVVWGGALTSFLERITVLLKWEEGWGQRVKRYTSWLSTTPVEAALSIHGGDPDFSPCFKLLSWLKSMRKHITHIVSACWISSVSFTLHGFDFQMKGFRAAQTRGRCLAQTQQPVQSVWCALSILRKVSFTVWALELDH